MSKKKRQDMSQAATTDAPFNSAFAGLAALRGDAPAAEPSVEPEPPSPTDVADPVKSAPKLVARREKKGRGGKTVTCIEGFRAGAELSELARSMAKGLGCGATVEEGQIILQGAQSERAADWLRARGAKKVVVGN